MTPLSDLDPLLADLQCNILAAHKRTRSVHLFGKLPPTEQQARQYLRAWATRMTSMQDQLAREPERRQNLQKWIAASNVWYARWWRRTWRFFASANSPVPFVPRRPAVVRRLVRSVMLTKAGLDRIRVTLPSYDVGMDMMKFTPYETEAFFNDAATLPDITRSWVPPFQDNTIEIQILLASDDPKELADAITAERNLLESPANQGSYLGQCDGYQRMNAKGRTLEHFGFVDGISNPVYLESGVSHPDLGNLSYTEKCDRFVFPLTNALRRLTFDDGTSFGSFQVFRQIEQNVDAFNQRYVIDKARDRAIGRHPDGTPLVDTAGGLNAFNYTTDSTGLKCPFHAHIRKSNPRADTLPPIHEHRATIFARRAMLYGNRPFDAKRGTFTGPDPTAGVGLLFMGYMGTLMQFRTMQKAWLSTDTFSHAPLSGFDPLVPLPPKANPVTTVKGAAYFFVPPRSWLLNPRSPTA